MSKKTRLLNSAQMSKLIETLGRRILRRVRHAKGVALIGIKTRGEFLAKRLAKQLSRNIELETGTLDITLYRDDLNVLQENLAIGESRIDFDLNGKTVVIVDDVLFTGRTVRAALDQILDLGRPAAVHLAILLDRGHRELPICPDYCGMKIRTTRSDRVEVRLKEKDGRDEAYIIGQ
ncbi:MAG: bifunctional pyr operon transcriptional regulator/uracil phosphoribosyltransferase PyrR [archaeon]